MMENEILKKELHTYTTNASNLFGKFRVIFYTSVIKNTINEISKKSKPSYFSFKLNADNVLYVCSGDDKVTLIYGIHFSSKTDMSLAKSFYKNRR
jgi:hypothetical protein